MRVLDVLTSPEPCFSFEFFPPKTPAGEVALFRSIEQLKEQEPGFVSVTCGAMGTTRGRTVEWASTIKHEVGIEPLVHMTCLGVSLEEIDAAIDQTRQAGLTNILALRGDPPQDLTPVPKGAFQFANELISYIRSQYSDACLLAACYPEGHTESPNKLADIDALKLKSDAGTDAFVTQLFFDNSKYFEILGRARSAGITQPIVPGIMPIKNVEQVKRFTQICGATIPSHLLKLLEQYKDSQSAVFYIGIAHAIAQCRELLESGVPGVHFYTLNKSPATKIVVEALRKEIGDLPRIGKN